MDIETIRHSLSHIMASAVLQMFPDAKLGIGPAIDNGFYYDFDLPRPLVPEDLKKIEKNMRKLIKDDFVFEKRGEDKTQSISHLEDTLQMYKVELAKEIDDANPFPSTIPNTTSGAMWCFQTCAPALMWNLQKI